AALNPASGDWKFFFAVTNGETIFNDTYQGHLNDLAAARKSGAL
ncbi:MAG: endolytic transglycosylase MltG, partial [Actinomycetales bacterium]|nr:endolytic transglycosylase MltG [Actinomycetales bacterium]